MPAAAAAAFGEVVATRGFVTGAAFAPALALAPADAGPAVAAGFAGAAFAAAGLVVDALAGDVFAARGGRGLAVGFGSESAMSVVPRVRTVGDAGRAAVDVQPTPGIGRVPPGHPRTQRPVSSGRTDIEPLGGPDRGDNEGTDAWGTR